MPRIEEAQRTERRRSLVDAARRLLARAGYRSLTVDDVCREAGVSKGAFYTYFEGKHDLLLALLDEEAASVRSLMEDVEREDPSGTQRLRRFARAMLERGEDPGTLQLPADLWAEMSSDPQVRERWRAAMAERRAVLRSWIDRAIEAGELAPLPSNALAAIVLALGDGLMLHHALDPSGFRWTNVRRALDMLLAGAAR
ncbi:MAG TPA: TetR/AcrR family transcriptional regulator [Actinomycetota bacterium]|nr:TetR/AcrR family transcriptional regulator [Actinomycetota bacterium]